MKTIKILLLISVLSLIAFTTAHKFYTSVTQVEYIKEKQSIQIITRIFIEDIENVLRERYDQSLTLSEIEEKEQINDYIGKYLTSKINIKIDNIDSEIVFLGKEYANDVIICYLEIKNVESIKSFEITNTVLFDLNSKQQNIVRTNINTNKKSFILIQGNDKGLLNF